MDRSGQPLQDVTGGSAEAVVHASCVARAGHAVLIRGASGTGKSALALQLLASGAVLVADDRVRLRRAGGRILAAAPTAIRGRIEARGLGLLHAPVPPAPQPLGLVIDMDTEETDRLPPRRVTEIMGLRLALVRKTSAAHFPAAVLLYLLHGRCD